MEDLDDIFEDSDETLIKRRPIAVWARRLNVVPAIVEDTLSNGSVMFLRTDMVTKLQGNPFNAAKKRDAKRSYIENSEPMRELPLLVVSATSKFAYLSEGNHRLWAWKSLGLKWFPVQISLSWNARPLNGWQLRRRERGFLTLFNTDESVLPLPNIGYPSYTPNSATPQMMRRVYGLEVLSWQAPPISFYDVPDSTVDAFNNELLMLTCNSADLTCTVCSRPADSVCSGCDFERYCSEACQRHHFETHHEECWID